jgi:hypothetical protein
MIFASDSFYLTLSSSAAILACAFSRSLSLNPLYAQSSLTAIVTKLTFSSDLVMVESDDFYLVSLLLQLRLAPLHSPDLLLIQHSNLKVHLLFDIKALLHLCQDITVF